MLRVRYQRRSLPAIVRCGALAYLIVWQLSPPLAYGVGWRGIALLAMLLWLVADTLTVQGVLRRPNWPVVVGAVFVCYTFIVEWLVQDQAGLNRQFQIWIMLFFLLVGESHQRGRSDEARFCFWVILLVLPIWSVTTLWGIDVIGAGASRAISRSSEEARELLGHGIGGYGFVYTLVLCLPILVYLTINPISRKDEQQPQLKRLAKRLLLMGNCILAMLVVLRAGYAIALILTVVAILGAVLVRSRQIHSLVISVCFLSVLALVMSMSVDPILHSLEGVTAGTEYSAKVRDIRYSLANDQSTGTFEGRAERYARSLSLLVENPVLGTLRFDDIGKHSAILDRFAQYGFGIGLLFLVLLIFLPFRYLRSRQVPIGLSLPFTVVAFGFPMLNNVFMSWGLILYVFSRGALAIMGVPLRTNRRHYSGEASSVRA